MIIKPELIRKPTRREFLKYAGVTALAFGVPALLPKRAFAAWDKGFNFRSSAGYVTDPTDCTYVGDQGGGVGEVYPITRNSVTFGYVAAHNAGNLRDRDNAGGHEKVAGVHFGDGSNIHQFQVDLIAAGVYDIYVALGDPAGGAGEVHSKIYDGTVAGTLLATLGPASISSGQFMDATGVTRTNAADWIANQVKITKTFATTTFTITIERNLAPLTHVFLSQVGGGDVSSPGRRRSQ